MKNRYYCSFDGVWRRTPCAHGGCRRLDYKPQAQPARSNDDALSNRPAEPGSAEYAYMHRYDSPDNERDSMG